MHCKKINEFNIETFIIFNWHIFVLDPKVSETSEKKEEKKKLSPTGCKIL